MTRLALSPYTATATWVPFLDTFNDAVVDLIKARKCRKLSFVTTCEPSRRKAMSISVSSKSEMNTR